MSPAIQHCRTDLSILLHVNPENRGSSAITRRRLRFFARSASAMTSVRNGTRTSKKRVGRVTVLV
jgi:hypothetical protein